MAAKEVSMADISRVVGVSVSSVSRALRGDASISQETRNRVNIAADTLGYQRVFRKAQAKKQSTPKSDEPELRKIIALVGDELVQKLYSEALLHLNKEAYKFAFQVEIQPIPKGQQLVDAVKQSVHAGASAIVLFVLDKINETQARSFLALGVPVVCINRHIEGLTNSVTVNEYGIGKNVARYLYSLGHRRIAYLCGDMSNWSHCERAEGFRFGLKQLGCFAPELIRPIDFANSVETTCSHMRELMALPAPPTAIWGLSDQHASMIMTYAATAGIKIPDDLSVLGYGRQDNTEMATCDYRSKEIGKHILLLLSGLLNGTIDGPTRICVDPLIIEGKTTRRI